MRTLLATVTGLALLVGGAGSALAWNEPYTWSISSTATDVFGRAPGKLEVALTCNHASYGVNWSYSSGSPVLQNFTYNYSQVDLRCTFGTSTSCSTTATVIPHKYTNYGDGTYTYDDIQSCTFATDSKERVIAWIKDNVAQQTPTAFGTISGTSLNMNRTWTANITNVTPVPDVYWGESSKYNNYTTTSIARKSRTAWNFTTNAWSPVTKGASAVLFKSTDGVYDRPVVIVDGWDPTNDRDAFALYANAPFVHLWQSQGLDIWFVDPAEGSESMKAHVDDLAWAFRQIAQYGGLNRIDFVIGVSAGGVVSRHAMAAMEHAKNGGTIPSWFYYGLDATAKTYGNPVKGFVSWDSPHAGANGIPRQMFYIFRKLATLTKQQIIDWCNPKAKWIVKGWFGRIVGRILGMTPIGWTMGTGFAGSNVIRAWKEAAQQALTAPVIDAASTKELLNDWCPPGATSPTAVVLNPSLACNGTNAAAFRTAMNTFNGTGRPTLTKLYAFSEGSWAQLACLWPDMWGPGTCSGSSGYYQIDEFTSTGYKWVAKGLVYAENSPKFRSPHNVGTISAGAKFMQIDFLDSRCRNDPAVYLEAKDVEPGSVSTVLNEYVEMMPVDGANLNIYLSSTFVTIKSALNMTSSTSTTVNKDVQWAAYAARHEDIQFYNFFFLNKLVYEFTKGDKDGTVTCAVPTGWERLTIPGRVGRFCDCDPNDASTATVGACGTTPTCVPNLSCTGLDYRHGDGCGGYKDCGPPATQVCGDGVCSGTETNCSCADCPYLGVSCGGGGGGGY
jgi:hypothetical protein